jgi:hypothetical protein
MRGCQRHDELPGANASPLTSFAVGHAAAVASGRATCQQHRSVQKISEQLLRCRSLPGHP